MTRAESARAPRGVNAAAKTIAKKFEQTAAHRCKERGKSDDGAKSRVKNEPGKDGYRTVIAGWGVAAEAAKWAGLLAGDPVRGLYFGSAYLKRRHSTMA